MSDTEKYYVIDTTFFDPTYDVYSREEFLTYFSQYRECVKELKEFKKTRNTVTIEDLINILEMYSANVVYTNEQDAQDWIHGDRRETALIQSKVAVEHTVIWNEEERCFVCEGGEEE